MRKRDTTEELRQQVLELREEGLSFSKISRKLGISKGHAVELAKAQDALMPRPEATNPTALMVRRQRFAAGLLGGESKRQAAIDAGVPAGGADAFGQRTLKDPRFRSELGTVLDQAGLSLERIAQVHAENLQATKVVGYATKGGQITDVLGRPDYAVRQRAVSDAWCAHGVPEEVTAQENNFGCVIVKLDFKTARMLEELRGSPLPATIEILPEEGGDEQAPAVPGAPPVTAPAVSTSDETAQPGVGETPEQSPNIPPWPADTRLLSPEEAADLARRRGESEKAIATLESMQGFHFLIRGADFKSFCQGEREFPRLTPPYY